VEEPVVVEVNEVPPVKGEVEGLFVVQRTEAVVKGQRVFKQPGNAAVG
jgi:hypothetical protein